MALKKSDINEINSFAGSSGLKTREGVTETTRHTNKDALIRVRIPESDKAVFESYCREVGSSLSTEIRRLLYDFMREKGMRR